MANQRRRRMLPTVLSRDLLNLALVLAFLHVDPESYLGLDNFNNMHQHHKILDDLSSLGRFSDQLFDFHEQPLEISAYILNAETSFNSAVNISQPSENHNNTSQQQNNEENLVVPMDFDQDSGVSDVDSGNQSDEDGLSSIFQPGSSLASPAQLGDLDSDGEWILRSDVVKLEEPEVPRPLAQHHTDYNALFDTDESSNIFRDLDDIIGQSSSSVLQPPSDVSTNQEQPEPEIEFSPDEEDVENQLMHIDDQLIRLDENIEDISDHLDVQLLNTASVVGNEALLTQEEENILFSSMPEVMDPMQNWDLAASTSGSAASGVSLTGTDPRDQEIEELIAAGLPSPLMPSPFMVAVDDVPKNITGENPVVKEEIKEEPLDDHETQLYGGHATDLDWLEPYMSPPLSPADSLASSTLPTDLLATEETPVHLLDHDYALSAFDDCSGSEIGSSLSQKTSSSYMTSSDYLGGASAMGASGSSESGMYRPSKDERKAKEINLPFEVRDIVDLPIDAFNELVARHTLTEAQMNLCRDIRRRGKNKVAAQNCRKRKNDLISQLEEEVTRARQHKQDLLAERAELYRMRTEWTHKLLNLETAVRRGMNLGNSASFDYTGATVEVTRLAKSKA